MKYIKWISIFAIGALMALLLTTYLIRTLQPKELYKLQLQIEAKDIPASLPARKALFENISAVLTERINNSGDADIESLTPASDFTSFTCMVNMRKGIKPSVLQPLFSSSGRIEMYNTFEAGEVGAYIEQMYEYIKATASPVDNTDKGNDINPLSRVFSISLTPNGREFTKGAIIGYSQNKDIPQVNSYLQNSEVQKLFPRDLKLMWSARPLSPNTSFVALYAIRSPTDSPAPITTEMIMNATANNSHDTIWEVTLFLTAEGALKFEKMTEEAATGNLGGTPIQRSIAIVMDNKVLSAPVVKSKITRGRMTITQCDEKQARYMANILTWGILPAAVHLSAYQKIND